MCDYYSFENLLLELTNRSVWRHISLFVNPSNCFRYVESFVENALLLFVSGLVNSRKLLATVALKTILKLAIEENIP